MQTPPPADATNTVVVLGPTASGKTRLAVHLAARLGGEVLSADSRQVYRGLTIGAGKDLDEYTVGGRAIPHHLIDVCGLDHEFSVFEYQQRCFEALEACWARSVVPVVCGGTGLYLEAVLQGYRMVAAPENPALRAALAPLSNEELTHRLRDLRPGLHNTTDTTDRARTIRAIEIAAYTQEHPPAPAPAIRPVILGVQWPRETLRRRIRTRLRERMRAGLVAEVQGLLDAGVSPARLDLLGLEYRFVTQFLQGAIPNEYTLTERLGTAIMQFAKRQETWFRRMERRGTAIHWIPQGDPETAWAVVAGAGLRGREL